MAQLTNQIKSKQRVKDFAEVFTNEREVKAMCDLIPLDVWENIESTFLEPACGTGNFLVEILERKYRHCKTADDGLKALKSITAIDIQDDNCRECRKRLLEQYISRFLDATKENKSEAKNIVQRNVICGNSLEIMKKWEED